MNLYSNEGRRDLCGYCQELWVAMAAELTIVVDIAREFYFLCVELLHVIGRNHHTL